MNLYWDYEDCTGNTKPKHIPKGMTAIAAAKNKKEKKMNCETCEVDTVQGCACCEVMPDHHKYSAKECPKCGKVFCYSCCGGTNVDQGGKYEPDYMFCPACGADFYAE